MAVGDLLRQRYWALRGHYSPLPDAFVAPLAGARVLEIGGPSGVFAAGGLAPVYQRAGSVDNVQFAATTAWHDLEPQSDAFRVDGTVLGRQYFADDPDLSFIADGAYDAVISSHVIEHFANPLRAIDAWRRVTGESGVIVLIAPHKEGTFDRRRAVTTLKHMIEDHEKQTDEGDLTHLQETLGLHDFARDTAPASREAWVDARRRNAATRVLHHHVFTTTSLLDLVCHAGVVVDAHTSRYPHDIYVLGHFARAGDTVPVVTPSTGPFQA